MKSKPKIANEFRNEHGVFSDTANKLSKETERFVKRMCKKYNSELSYDGSMF